MIQYGTIRKPIILAGDSLTGGTIDARPRIREDSAAFRAKVRARVRLMRAKAEAGNRRR